MEWYDPSVRRIAFPLVVHMSRSFLTSPLVSAHAGWSMGVADCVGVPLSVVVVGVGAGTGYLVDMEDQILGSMVGRSGSPSLGRMDVTSPGRMSKSAQLAQTVHYELEPEVVELASESVVVVCSCPSGPMTMGGKPGGRRDEPAGWNTGTWNQYYADADANKPNRENGSMTISRCSRGRVGCKASDRCRRGCEYPRSRDRARDRSDAN